MKEHYTTEEHANTLIESWINGQRKQMVEQYSRARHDGITAGMLVSEWVGLCISPETVANMLVAIIEGLEGSK